MRMTGSCVEKGQDVTVDQKWSDCTSMLSCCRGKKGECNKEQGSPQDHEAPLLLSSVSVCPQLR